MCEVNLDVLVNSIEDLISDQMQEIMPDVMIHGVSLMQFDDELFQDIYDVMLDAVYEQVKMRI